MKYDAARNLPGRVFRIYGGLYPFKMLPQVKILGLTALIALAWSLRPAVVASALPVPGAVTDSAHSYLALGDSYTIGESVPVEDRYPVQAIRMMNANHFHFTDPEIIATTGWTTADLLDAISRQTAVSARYDLVTLLIGVNNQYQGRSQAEYGIQFAELVRQSIRLAGNRPSRVLILSIPDYSVTPFARGSDSGLIASQIDSFNLINYRIAMEEKVNYLDITDESRKAATDPSLIAPDGLHFSGKEYGRWADRMKPVMTEMLK
jgi:lysophospholipase L1-like esterase